MEVRLSHYSAVTMEPVTIEILDYNRASETKNVGIDIFEVGPADFNSMMTTALRVSEGNGKLVATLSLDDSDFFKPGSLYEIGMLSPRGQQETIETLTGGEDFPRTFFQVKIADDDPSAIAEETAKAARVIEEEREANYARPLGDPSRPGHGLFRVLTFVERVMLTRRLRVPGVELIPLRNNNESYGNRSTDEAHIINGVLTELDWQVQLDDPADWAEQAARERPILLFNFPRVFAASHHHAAALAQSRRDRLLDLLTLYRDSPGVPFAVAVQELGTTRLLSEVTTLWPESQRYGGNIMGGFVSGEDPGTLLKHDRVMTNDPFVGLCLRLYREAKSETDLDVAFFKYWSLLEVIASDKVTPDARVTDFEGRHLWEGRKKATTTRARGRVYELIKSYVQDQNFVENPFDQHPIEGLWDAVGVWYACRNATAHYGKFRAADPRQQNEWWYGMAQKAYGAVASRGGYTEREPYCAALTCVAKELMQLLLDKQREQ